MPHIRLVRGPCQQMLREMRDESVHLIVTDPPYFIDGMGSDWDHEGLRRSARRAGQVGSLPVRMRFDRQQSYRLQEFMGPIAEQMFRVLRPGGFCVCFSQGRLIHRMGVALEDAGFEIRDLLGWSRHGQPKAQGQAHHVLKKVRDGVLTEEEGRRIIRTLGGRKTPQLGPRLEPMVLAMRPVNRTFVDNWMEHRTGLMDTTVRLDESFPTNLMEVPREARETRGPGNDHLTVKPVRLISHLIRLFSCEGQTVLDPFLGSGSHALAALETGRGFVGSEIELRYFDIARRRLIRAGAREVGVGRNEVTLAAGGSDDGEG